MNDRFNPPIVFTYIYVKIGWLIYLIYDYTNNMYVVNYMTQTESKHHAVIRLTVSDSTFGMKKYNHILIG